MGFIVKNRIYDKLFMIFLEREYKVNYGIENYIFIVKKEK
jgi:hypothetical protein